MCGCNRTYLVASTEALRGTRSGGAWNTHRAGSAGTAGAPSTSSDHCDSPGSWRERRALPLPMEAPPPVTPTCIDGTRCASSFPPRFGVSATPDSRSRPPAARDPCRAHQQPLTPPPSLPTRTAAAAVADTQSERHLLTRKIFPRIRAWCAVAWRACVDDLTAAHRERVRRMACAACASTVQGCQALRSGARGGSAMGPHGARVDDRADDGACCCGACHSTVVAALTRLCCTMRWA